LCSNELGTAKIENISAVYSIESGVLYFLMLVGETNSKAYESVFCQVVSLSKKLLQQISLNRRMYLLKWNFIKLKISDTVANFTALCVRVRAAAGCSLLY
jgi:hypothetical protein